MARPESPTFMMGVIVAKHIVVLTLEVEAEDTESAVDEIMLSCYPLSHSVKVSGMTVYEVTANTLFE